jgi:hypothetical protein
LTFISAKAADGSTALSLAEEEEDQDMITLLKNMGPNNISNALFHTGNIFQGPFKDLFPVNMTHTVGPQRIPISILCSFHI